MKAKSARERVLRAVAAIPPGRVSTYGRLGERLKLTARQVARVLSGLTPEESASVPWHRVVAAGGRISTVKLDGVGRRQIAKLREEGIDVTGRNTVIGFADVVWP